MKFFTHLAVGDYEVGPDDMGGNNDVVVHITGSDPVTITSTPADGVTITSVTVDVSLQAGWTPNTEVGGLNGVAATGGVAPDHLIKLLANTSEGQFSLMIQWIY